MKTRKRNYVILMLAAALLAVLTLGFASRFASPVAAEAAVEQTVFNSSVYLGNGYNKSVGITALSSGTYDGSICSDGAFRITLTDNNNANTYNSMWVRFYYKLYAYVNGGWTVYSGDTCFATMYYNRGNRCYEPVGTHWEKVGAEYINEVSVKEYTESAIDDVTPLKDFVVDKAGTTAYADLNIADGGLFKMEIKTYSIFNGGSLMIPGRNTSDWSAQFYVDRNAPNITLSCGESYSFSNSSVKVTYSDSYGCASGNYTRSIYAGFPSVASTPFSSGASFTDEGNYLISVVDNAGRTSRKYFTIDKTAPALSLSNVSNGGVVNSNVRVSWDTSVTGAGKQLANGNDAITVRYGYSPDYKIPSAATTLLSSAQTFSADGGYRVTVTDKAGNVGEYTFIIDTQAPVAVNAPDEYVNHSFVFSATDGCGVAGIEYRKDGAKAQTVAAGSVSVGLSEENYGAWQFRAYDAAGNYTPWHAVNLYCRATFGNRDEIYNSYYLPAYYVVNLPSKVYPDISGRYTFADYSAALAWAVKKEWEYRVVDLGSKWSYVNIANESVYQIYSDRAELDAAVSKYAASYVSDRIVTGENGGTLSNPVGGDGAVREDALTAQISGLPAHLSAYSGLPVMLARSSQSFSRPISGVAGNTCTLTVRYISNGIGVQNGAEITLEYGVSLKNALEECGMWRQGYFLVAERDACGNSESYILCIDTGEPTLTATATGADGIKSEVQFTKAFTEQYAGTLRYVSLDLEGLSDSIDGYVMLHIEGRGFDGAYYVQGDELPHLSYEDGYYGEYAVTVYDRSLNKLQFSLRIAGAAPTVTHTSLANETKCTLTIVMNDSGNALTSVKLYKVAYTGEYAEKLFDDDNTPLGVQSLSYVLRTGGKYVLELTDVYGRTVTTEPMFYMKGLPAGTLSGVKEGGLTNGDVTFLYGADCSVILYAWQGGAWVAADYMAAVTDGETVCKSAISAGADTSYKFKYFLYVTDDMNLFTEYMFEIDCIPPSADIFNVNGVGVAPEAVTPESFYVTWSESGYTAYYYNRNAALGSLGQEKYTKGSVLSKAGTYVFDVYDAARNVTTFTVTLDNVVSWTLESPSYSVLGDGSFITKYSFTLTVTERTGLWQVTSTNGILPLNGQKIEADGTYSFRITDAYGNALNVVLIVDNLPPVPVIVADDGTALFDGGRTNKAFSLSCEEENVAITYSVNGAAYAAYGGAALDNEGTYVFRLVDRMGNGIAVTVIIDRRVSFTVGGAYVLRDGDYYSRTWITVSADEQCYAFAVTDEYGVAVDGRIDAEGEYNVAICDIAGNCAEFKVFIIKTAPVAVIETMRGERVGYGATVNGAFFVYCAADDVSITYVKGSGSFAVYDGAYLSNVGTYTFKITDFLGNFETFTVRIDLNVDFELGGSYAEDVDGNFVSRTWVSVTMREECSGFSIRSDNGRNYSESDRIAAEGVYTVVIEDASGNRASFNIIIDRTAPEIIVLGAIAGGDTRSDVQVVINGFTEAYFRVGGVSEKFALGADFTFTDEGEYTVIAKDLAGNEATAAFVIDKSVAVTPSRELAAGQIITGGVSFAFGEAVTATLEKDGAKSTYTRGSITDEGHYTFTVRDRLGNVKEFVFTVLPSRNRSYVFDFAEYCAVSVLRDGAVVSGVVDGNTVRLTETGVYSLRFLSAVAGESFDLTLTVDTLAPSVKITQEKKKITVSEPSKDDLTYTLFKDGKQVSFTYGDSITGTGDYRLEVTDSLGNTAEYTFKLHYINGAGIAFIVLACVIVFIFAVVVAVVRVLRRIR